MDSKEHINDKCKEQLLPLELRGLCKEGTKDSEEESSLAQTRLRIRPHCEVCVCS